jgi:hypothetical protein
VWLVACGSGSAAPASDSGESGMTRTALWAGIANNLVAIGKRMAGKAR